MVGTAQAFAVHILEHPWFYPFTAASPRSVYTNGHTQYHFDLWATDGGTGTFSIRFYEEN